MIEGSQENTKSCGVTKHVEGFGCYALAILKKKHRNNAPATTAVGHGHTGALNCGGKTKIGKKHQAFEVIG